jgi:predicted amidohydrolase YtcJ
VIRWTFRVSGGTVTDVGTALGKQSGDDFLDCGGTVLPGLTDHHLHLLSMAAARTSVRCGPPAVTSRVGLAATLAAAAPDENGWIRGTGYVKAGWPSSSSAPRCRTTGSRRR